MGCGRNVCRCNAPFPHLLISPVPMFSICAKSSLTLTPQPLTYDRSTLVGSPLALEKSAYWGQAGLFFFARLAKFRHFLCCDTIDG